MTRTPPAAVLARALAAGALLCGLAGCELRRVPDGAWRLRALAAPSIRGAQPPVVAPRVYSLRADALAQAKRRVRNGDAVLRVAFERLVREADSAMHVP